MNKTQTQTQGKKPLLNDGSPRMKQVASCCSRISPYFLNPSPPHSPPTEGLATRSPRPGRNLATWQSAPLRLLPT